jgi:hypothetical protein
MIDVERRKDCQKKGYEPHVYTSQQLRNPTLGSKNVFDLSDDPVNFQVLLHVYVLSDTSYRFLFSTAMG